MSHEEFQSCIDACFACATECRHCASACLDEPEVNQLTRCIKLNNDCATVCILAAGLMAGESEFSIQIGELCAEVCTACASECGQHAHMEHCRECAEACRRCADECRQMNQLPVE